METKDRELKTTIDLAIINTVITYTKTVLNKYNIVSVWIFGSFAKGTEQENSDIDIAVVFENLNDKFQAQFNLMKMRRKIDIRIEPHPLDKPDSNVTNQFADEIQRTGLKIYQYEKGIQHWFAA